MDLLRVLAESPPLFIGTCLAFGLLVGSFLNVVIYRLPVMLEREWRAECADLCAGGCGSAPDTTAAEPEKFNLVVPRSACPKCKAPITALQNIPVVSYLLLKGKCATCGVR